MFAHIIEDDLYYENHIEKLNTHKASFRSEHFDLESNNKEALLKGKKGLLFISVGQAYHEERKLLSTIKWINKDSFKECDLVIADTLQRLMRLLY